MFNNNYYKDISEELKKYIQIEEKDFNKSPENVREYFIKNAEMKNEENNNKIIFENIPFDIKEHIKIDKDTFEELDILCQQLIIKYVFKYKELLNRNNMVITKEVEKNNPIENFLLNINIILGKSIYTEQIVNIKNTFNSKIEENNKCVKRLKANIRNNKKKIINNINIKPVSIYEKKVFHYELELNKILLINKKFKNLFMIFKNIIALSMPNNKNTK